MPIFKPHAHHDDARRLTEALRRTDDPTWRGVRTFLKESGFDPSASAVGDLFPEDVGEFGVLVTPDRRAFTFVVEYRPTGGRQDCRVIEWEERSEAGSRFAYAPAIFAAMSLLEAEVASQADPLDVLVDYVAELTRRFRQNIVGNRWAPVGYWSTFHRFLENRSIGVDTTVALAWATTSEEIDGSVLDHAGRCYHFTGSLEALHGPIREITTWEELDESEARATYGDLVDAGFALRRREGQ